MNANKSFRDQLQKLRDQSSQEAACRAVVLHSEPLEHPPQESRVISSNENTFGTPQVLHSDERKEEEEVDVLQLEKSLLASKLLSRISELESHLEHLESEKGEAANNKHEEEITGLRQEITQLNLQLTDMRESIKSLLEDLHRCN